MQGTQTILIIVTCVINAIGAIAIWLTKVWWTNEFNEAKKAQIEAITSQLRQITISKDEVIKTKDVHIEKLKAETQSIKELASQVIKAKEAQIDSLKNDIQNLRELTPMKIQEYFNSVKSQLESYNDYLKRELEQARKEVEEVKLNIETATIEKDFLIVEGYGARDLISRLSEEKTKWEEKAELLKLLEDKLNNMLDSMSNQDSAQPSDKPSKRLVGIVKPSSIQKTKENHFNIVVKSGGS